MNKIPSELFNIICENLSHYDKLMLMESEIPKLCIE